MSDLKDQNKGSRTSSKKKSKRGPAKKPTLLENIFSLGFVLILVLMFRSSVIESVKVPSGSMLPTILIGDYIFVSKFAYGIKIPFSDFFTSDPIHVVERDGPSRGDIIVFNYPLDESIYYIKRVVGVPGDQLEVRNKVLFINGTEMSQTEIPQAMRSEVIADEDLGESRLDRHSLEIAHEQLDDVDHIVMFNRTHRVTQNYGPIQIPEDSYFVMGDNRDNSNDSRFWGFVPRRVIKGKALMIWLSVWLDFEQKDFSFRPSRIGTLMF